MIASIFSWLQARLAWLKQQLTDLATHGHDGWRYLVLFNVVVILVPFFSYSWFRSAYAERIFPEVKIASIPVAGLEREVAREQVEQVVMDYRAQWPEEFAVEGVSQPAAWHQAQVGFRVQEAVHNAYMVGRRGDMVAQFQEVLSLFGESQAVELPVEYSRDWWEQLSASMAAQIDREPIPPALSVVETASGSAVLLQPGEDGRRLQTEQWRRQFETQLSRFEPLPVSPPVAVEPVAFSQEELSKAKDRAERLLSKTLTVSPPDDLAGSEAWQLTETELVGFVGFESKYDQEQIVAYLTEVAASLNRPPQNAKFQFDESAGKVQEFLPAQNGVALEVQASTERMVERLQELEASAAAKPVTLVVTETEPEITLDDANDLGIETLLGRGVSTYHGSIPSRVHNVGLAAARISGTLVKPGEVYSFNQSVGEISKATGYEAAYVISNGRTELGDGGGVCQDSTTVFRAALDAGLPIVERHPHSYRVGYYEQNAEPGLDATVYAPSVDLKFENTTPAHILVQARADEANRSLVVEIYGTDDGRESAITNHQVWDVTPPPPDKYVDDPTLPAGTVKQVDWKAWGAKARFDYTVRREGEIHFEKTFYSSYSPWAAVFLRGTGG